MMRIVHLVIFYLNICSVCKDGFGVDLKTGKCGKCQSSICKSCIYDSTFCIEYFDIITMCELGFGFNQIFECEKCIDNCESCFFNSSACTKCKTGFSIEIGVNEEAYCVKCKDDNCIECNRKASLCEICKEGYKTNHIGEDINECISINDDDPGKNNNNSNKNHKTVMIIGIIISCIVVIAIVVFVLIYIFVIRKNKNKELSNNQDDKDDDWEIRPDGF